MASHIDTYVEHLLSEISLRGRYFDGRGGIDQMHFGGGTPTYLPKKRLAEIVGRLDQEFRLSGDTDRDYSIETILVASTEEYCSHCRPMAWSKSDRNTSRSPPSDDSRCAPSPRGRRRVSRNSW